MATLAQKDYRTKVAEMLARVAKASGGESVISHESRSTRLDVTFPNVRCAIDLDNLFKGGILAHWYGATLDLESGYWFDSVNEHHRHKATQYGDNDIEFTHKFGQACRAIASGKAFRVGEAA